MAENDIYNNQGKYERYKKNLESFLLPPEQRPRRESWTSRYYCKNPDNLKHFRRLFIVVEAQDISYIRRCRLIEILRVITYYAEKELSLLDREDVDVIIAGMHKTHKSPESKKFFIRVIKWLWRKLFPELDERGRIDETITPYAVRHLKAEIDRSKLTSTKDRLYWTEYVAYLRGLTNDPMMQCYLGIHFECYGRPQELCYLKRSNFQIFDDYAIGDVREHGKEGPRRLLIIDSFPYFIRWYNLHPSKDTDAYFFLNEHGKQFTPGAANKRIRSVTKLLGLKKHITNYTFKRSGVTISAEQGEPSVLTQHKAGWTSDKQRKTYILTSQSDAFNTELARRGLLKDSNYKPYSPKNRTCQFCDTLNGFAEEVCVTCKRPLDRTKVKEQIRKQKEEAVAEHLKSPEMEWLLKTVKKFDVALAQKK